MEVEAAIEMARHLDEKGLYWVWTEFSWFGPNQPNLEKFAWFESPKLAKPKFDQSFVKVQVVCTQFVKSFVTNRTFFWGKCPIGKIQTFYKLLQNFCILYKLWANVYLIFDKSLGDTNHFRHDSNIA
jgi:hypothetical protein